MTLKAFFADLPFGLSEEEITKKLKKFGYWFESETVEGRVYLRTTYTDSSLSFAIDPEKGMYHKSYFIREPYNGGEIDEIFEEHLEILLDTVNTDIDILKFDPDPNMENMRMAIFSNEIDYWFDGRITLYIHEGMVTVEYAFSKPLGFED